MVAKINTSKTISKALNYNEQKVQQGKAVLLAVSGFVKEIHQLNFYDKLRHFERLTSLNERTVTNTLHVSLNFDPVEKLSPDQLKSIAETYMNKIGFGDQPYLVYRHDDAGHPHLHIVSTNITHDSSRISMHNLGRNQSEKARKEIENDFGLVKAESKSVVAEAISPVNAQKVIYAKSETKRAIANVLMMVLQQYKYCSLPELNAVLKLYNVTAECGLEDSRIFRNKGLLYRVLNDKGEKVGIPIKASTFYMKPTLSFLEQKFETNRELKAPHKRKLQTTINWALHQQPPNLQAFILALEKENIRVLLRIGKGDVLYGITYIDLASKCVFNGSQLGKSFSAKGIEQNWNDEMSNSFNKHERLYKSTNDHESQASSDENDIIENISFLSSLLMPPANTMDYVPQAFKKKKKKKQRSLSV